METRLLVPINFLGFACRPILLLICLFFLSANSGKHLLASTHGETAQVTNLKATFFVNTLKYVRWDNRDLPSAEIPIRLLIVGDDHTNFKSRLEYLLNVSDVEIYLLDNNGKATYGVKLVEAFPKTIGANEFNMATTNELQKISVTFAYRYWIEKINNDVGDDVDEPGDTVPPGTVTVGSETRPAD